MIHLAKSLLQKPDLFLLDEPTSHIDIPTKETLEDAISDFEGTFLFVSHDRYFINKFANRIIEFENGKSRNFLGNYDDYKKEKSSL